MTVNDDLSAMFDDWSAMFDDWSAMFDDGRSFMMMLRRIYDEASSNCDETSSMLSKPHIYPQPIHIHVVNRKLS